MIDLILSTLAAFGLTALITDYDGAFGVFRRLRKYKLFNCTVCTATWLSIPIAYFAGIGVIGYLATIGGVIIIERVT